MTTKTHSRTCLCPPPGSATWHCAHFVLKIFAPMSTKVKGRERQCVVSKTSHEKTQKKEGMLLKEILHISYPWRRLLRELLQTKPFRMWFFFLWFFLLLFSVFLIVVVWWACDEKKNFFSSRQKRLLQTEKRREERKIHYWIYTHLHTYTLRFRIAHWIDWFDILRRRRRRRRRI